MKQVCVSSRGVARIFGRGFPKTVLDYQSRGLGVQPPAGEKF